MLTSAAILSAFGNALFILAMLAASARCLLLWRRTRQTPELTIGLGFGSIAGLGYPLMAISGVGDGRVSDVDPLLIGAGMCAICLGVFSLQVFTWQAFRPRSAWAPWLVVATFLGAVVVCWGSMQGLRAAAPDASALETGRVWWLGLRLVFEAWYVWTAVEGLIQYRQARRRLQLGLSDPVVVNRFLLWGMMGVFLTLNGLVASWLEWQGMSPLTDISAALTLAANGVVAGVLILLTFMPPRAYLAFVRRRAGAEG